MVTQDEAQKIVDWKAASIVLEDYQLKVEEDTDCWKFIYTPKRRVRGGGFELRVSKHTGQITGITRFQ